MPQFTLTGLDTLVKNIEQKAEEEVKQQIEGRLKTLSDAAVDMSPIWSGSYVRSFSLKANTASSRGRGTDGRHWRFKSPTGTEADREQGRSNLYSDLSEILVGFDLSKLRKVTLRNDSGHAGFVERGNGLGPYGPKAVNGYKIFARLRNLYG